MKKQIQLSIDNRNIDSVIPKTIDLFVSGLHWLNSFPANKVIRFSQWASLIRKARGDNESISADKLLWLWEAIIAEPTLKKIIGDRIVSLDEEWKEMPQIECFSKGTRFGIFFNASRLKGFPMLKAVKDCKPDAIAWIDGPLFLRPGKARRLECQDVETVLELKVDDIGKKNEEAASLLVDQESIEIKASNIRVKLKSLNHAYTKASLRLEPHRRIPGGRVYDHVAFQKDDLYIPLENMRIEKEKGLWEKLTKIVEKES